jgi:hypothetical protein
LVFCTKKNLATLILTEKPQNLADAGLTRFRAKVAQSVAKFRILSKLIYFTFLPPKNVGNL